MAVNVDAFVNYGNQFQQAMVNAIAGGRGARVGDQNIWARLTREYRTFRQVNGLPPDHLWPHFDEITRRARRQVTTGIPTPPVRVFAAPVAPPIPLVGGGLLLAQAQRVAINNQMMELENERMGNEQELQQEQLHVQDGGGGGFARQRIRQLTSSMGPWSKKTLTHGNFLYSKEFQFTGKWRKGDENEVVQKTPNFLRTTKMGSGVPFISKGSLLGEKSVDFGKTTNPNIVHIPSKIFFHFLFFYFFIYFLWIILNLLDTKPMTDHYLERQARLRNYRNPFPNVKHNILNKPPRGIDNKISREFEQSYNQQRRQNGKI